ncbi:MAG: helix-turn-helix domain-containing protein [Acidimicrobiales bacterium]|nr:helix-turn-helix domain-containing protein [Acidimicrobiales bacterium]
MTGSTDGGRRGGSRPVPDERLRKSRLDILKALGDNTRYAIYLELARSPLPLATAEIADVLGLHVNTVRPHLERMREVGLLQVHTEGRGTVGRPQHRYSLAPDAPSLGLEPSPYPTMARVLLYAAHEAGLDRSELAEAGRVQGGADAQQWTDGTACLEALIVEQAKLGFDPAVVDDDQGATMAFAHCPFRELAEAYPDLVCGLHCGLVEGFVETLGGARVAQFHSLLARTPCQVELALEPAGGRAG